VPTTQQKGTSQIISELWEMVRAYAKQETVDPLKQLWRFVAFGTAAAVIGGVGVILVLLAVLRALQAETGPHLTGSLSWVPYLATLGVATILAALSGLAITRKKGTRP
jgi:hypothetical protein